MSNILKGSHHEQLQREGIIKPTHDARLTETEKEEFYVVLLVNRSYNQMTEKTDTKSRQVKIRKEQFENFRFLDYQKIYLLHSPDDKEETERKFNKVYSKKYGKNWKEQLEKETITILLPEFKTRKAKTQTKQTEIKTTE